MCQEQENVFYYLTVENENYPQPPMPDGKGVKEGILKGMYVCRPASHSKMKLRAQILGTGSILNEALKAQDLLADEFQVGADVWSVTSYKELHREAQDAERWNMLHPDKKPKTPYVTKCLAKTPGPVVFASDYMKVLPDTLGRWVPKTMLTLGTDGFGRSESREALRDHFEVDARFIALATLVGLARDGAVETGLVTRAMKKLDIDPEKANPLYA
jgi:pyruvate dehydrogenase E1 component